MFDYETNNLVTGWRKVGEKRVSEWKKGQPPGDELFSSCYDYCYREYKDVLRYAYFKQTISFGTGVPNVLEWLAYFAQGANWVADVWPRTEKLGWAIRRGDWTRVVKGEPCPYK